MSWNDEDDSASGDESSDEMFNLALVIPEDEVTIRGNTYEILVGSDLDDNTSEDNTFNFYLSTSIPILDELNMQDHSNVSSEKFLELKAEINKVEENNGHFRKIV